MIGHHNVLTVIGQGGGGTPLAERALRHEKVVSKQIDLPDDLPHNSLSAPTS